MQFVLFLYFESNEDITMMQLPNIHEVLQKYWGYSRFRPLQEDIILSVLKGDDTLALLSTGGGKSICFQVPGICLPGLTLVITPLIALMKDQTERLKLLGIPAEAVYSGMTAREAELAMNHVMYGQAKFLYVSPERLTSEFFRETLRSVRISLIVVDEAHCISQWGYDFRPPYLRISEIRPMFPDVPVLALTATATPMVVKDIQQKLEFRKEKVFQGKYERPNLVYVVTKDENKLERLLRVLKGVPGQGIVYVRNRKKTRETSDFLRFHNISADYYHAGLPAKERVSRQSDWIQGFTRIIVCTNAFGMGIDKPDVRTVIHLDLPDSVEAYFQEAGRAGRDGKKSYAVLLYDEADLIDGERNLDTNFPEIDFIRNVYKALGNYYNLAIGTGRDQVFDMDITAFAKNYGLNPILTFNALKFIEREGYITLNEAMYASSRFVFNVSKQDLYKFQVEHPTLDILIKTMQRSYGGSFTEPVPVYEAELARRLETSEQIIKDLLNKMQQLGILTYFPITDKPQLSLTCELVKPEHLTISPENYKIRKADAVMRYNSLVEYATSTDKCRSKMLIEYFGQKTSHCGICDVCLESNKNVLSELEYNRIVEIIRPLLQLNELSIREMIDACESINADKVIKTVKWLVDNNKVIKLPQDLYKWN